MPVIEVSHLTKEYRLGALQGLKQTLLNTGARLMGKTIPERPLFKALDDVSFSIEQGEVVGIIGHNGAGKSTMLKMLARISTPTRGSVKVDGRIAPLIEVGAGFVPDFTGRENVYLNGAILGMSRQEIDKKFDEIVNFAEMAEFIDTPVKRYSSGMQVKLAFAVATSIESEILIVDEVLAVGDLAFQRKCFDRMENLIKREGRTVLIVSHNIRQIHRMCSRVILMDHGKITVDSSPDEVCNAFYQENNDKIHAFAASQNAKKPIIKSTSEFELISIEVIDPTGRPTNTIPPYKELRVRVTFKANTYIKRPEIVIGTHTTDFLYLHSSSTGTLETRPDFPKGIHSIEYLASDFPLVSGVYCLRLVVFDENRRKLFQGETLNTFSISTPASYTSEPELGLLKLPSEWILHGQKYQEPSTCDSSPAMSVNS
jgi:ABC-type polysaccharide/polyol phosphate transport system ATPase subunit